MRVVRFLAELFDANFDRLLCLTVVKILYVVELSVVTGVAGACVLLGGMGALQSDQQAIRTLGPVVVLLVGGLVFLLGTFVARLSCELLIVFYRIAGNTDALVGLEADRQAVVEPVLRSEAVTLDEPLPQAVS